MMRLPTFERAYDCVIDACRHKRSKPVLFWLSFAEASFFLIPPDVLLVPMVFSQRDQYLRLAWIATVGSVLGGVLGYAIGAFFQQTMGQYLLELYDLQTSLIHITDWYERYGAWVVLLAAFTPLPYKLVTVFSGIVLMNPLWFVLCSLLGRGLRFGLVALIAAKAQPLVELRLRRYFEYIGWGLVAAASGLLGYWVVQ